jgi:hypothetical protein
VHDGELFTVDFELREIRHLLFGQTPEFIPFESARGRVLLRAFRTSTSYDVLIQDEGTISLVRPLTRKARSWIARNVSKERSYQPYLPTLVVERRYLSDLTSGMATDGLAVGYTSQASLEGRSLASQ